MTAPLRRGAGPLAAGDLAVARELEAYATTMALPVSAGFADRVMAAIPAARSAPDLGRWAALTAWRTSAVGTLSTAIGRIAGREWVPVAIRLQAAGLVLGALLALSAGAALAVAGTASVIDWVAPRHVPTIPLSPAEPTSAPAIHGSSTEPSESPESSQPALPPRKPVPTDPVPTDHDGSQDTPGQTEGSGGSDGGGSKGPGDGSRVTPAPSERDGGNGSDSGQGH